MPPQDLKKLSKDSKSTKLAKQLARHVNRHTMLTAKCNTSANVPMLDVLANLAEQEEDAGPRIQKRKRGRPAKNQSQNASQNQNLAPATQPISSRKRRKKKALSDFSDDFSRQSTPLSTASEMPDSEAELDTEMDDMDYTEVYRTGKRRQGVLMDEDVPKLAHMVTRRRGRPTVSLLNMVLTLKTSLLSRLLTSVPSTSPEHINPQ